MGTPVIGCPCDVCKSTNPKNKRMRCSALLQWEGKKYLIDAGPDIRQQLLTHAIDEIDGLILTHTHFDHIAGLDELRIFSLKRKEALPCLLSKDSYEELQKRYYYLFNLEGKRQDAVVQLSCQVLMNTRNVVPFLDVPFKTFAYRQMGMRVDGFRLGDFAYVTDIKEHPETIFEDLFGVKTLVLGAIRPRHSYAHFTFEEAAEFQKRLGSPTTWLIHMDHEVEHDRWSKELGHNLFLGYDGLKVQL